VLFLGKDCGHGDIAVQLGETAIAYLSAQRVIWRLQIMWIGSWGNEAKQTAEEWLRLVNRAIAAAIAALGNGDYGEAIAQIRKAIGYKHEAIQAFPPVLVSDTNHRAEFYLIYDALFELDELAGSAENHVIAAKYGGNPNAVRDLIDQLKEAKGRLTDLKLNDPNFADGDCVDLTNAVIDVIDSILKDLEDFDPTKNFNYDRLHRLLKQLRDAKKALLDNLSDGYGISLWDCYVLFYDADDELLIALWLIAGSLADDAPVTARRNRIAKGHLEHAEAAKKKLEAYIHGNPAPSEQPEEGDGPPPKPVYPPGSEDLPPFPPSGLGLLASRKGKRRRRKA
jgi:hypothetical protein